MRKLLGVDITIVGRWGKAEKEIPDKKNLLFLIKN